MSIDSWERLHMPWGTHTLVWRPCIFQAYSSLTWPSPRCFSLGLCHWGRVIQKLRRGPGAAKGTAAALSVSSLALTTIKQRSQRVLWPFVGAPLKLEDSCCKLKCQQSEAGEVNEQSRQYEMSRVRTGCVRGHASSETEAATQLSFFKGSPKPAFSCEIFQLVNGGN